MPVEPEPEERRSQVDQDAFQAWMLAVNCLAYEADEGPAELEITAGRRLPRGLVWQHRYARRLLIAVQGDMYRLLAVAATCRSHADQDQDRAHLRAGDLCERAAAMVAEMAGEDPQRGRDLARRLDEEAPARVGYRVVWVVALPRPRPFRAELCMPQALAWQARMARQLRPVHGQGAECCWYHAGDWHQASQTAIRLVRAARRAGVAGADIRTHALRSAQAAGVCDWQLTAMESLLCPGYGIKLAHADGTSQPSFVNGQHRAQAMLDTGVRRTLTITDD